MNELKTAAEIYADAQIQFLSASAELDRDPTNNALKDEKASRLRAVSEAGRFAAKNFRHAPALSDGGREAA